jgi:hypothetical protein
MELRDCPGRPTRDTQEFNMEPASSISLSILAKPLITLGSSLAKAMVPHLRQLHAERQAGRESTVIHTDFIDSSLEATLSRLQQIEANDPWWHELYQRAAIAYVRPDYLAKPSVREWLTEDAVRHDLKALARGKLLPGSPDEALIRERLASRYAFHTLEAPQLATGPVDAVVNILLAGVLAPLGKETRFLAGLVHDATNQIVSHVDSRFQAVEQRLDTRPAHEIVDHTQTCQSKLTRILQRRSLPSIDAQTEIATLADRIGNQGNLRSCDEKLKSQVFLWAARLHASSRKDKADAARHYRDAALSIDASADTTFVDAWLTAGAGDVDAALMLLREVDSPDAHSNTLAMLAVHHGCQRALEWFDTHGAVKPDFFTATGWKNAVSMLAESERWSEAASQLAALPESYVLECPDILYVDGVVNVALILPEWLRPHTLRMEIIERHVEIFQGTIATKHRERALESFARASQLMKEIGALDRAAGAEIRRTWLLLKEPSTYQLGRATVESAMRQGLAAVEYAHLAYVFNIPFDTAPLEQHLHIRELSGGLAPQELFAKLALYRQMRPPADVARFLQEERLSLTAVLSPAGHSFLLARALAEAGQFDEAQQLISENLQVLGEDGDRILDQIRAQRGEDVLQSFEDRFLVTDSDIDLQNLCEHLRAGRDPDKLERYTRKLFERQKNVHNAHRVCDALVRLERNLEIVEFLKDNEDLVPLDQDLLALRAWSLYQTGSLIEAKHINDQLLQARDNPNDAKLQVNLAVAMGEWEKFPVILDREWTRRDTREAKHLLQLARLAGDVDKQRASQLMEDATRKAPTDPQVLANAAMLAYRLGQDGIAAPFMVEAARLSPADGPVKMGGMRDLVELVEAGADRTRGVQEAFAGALIPLHVAAKYWNIPLTRLLIGQALDNQRARDPRHRTVIPLRHGSRNILEISQIRTVLVDFSSLLLAAQLELLPQLTTRFDTIFIPWSAMELLLIENQSCRFHQPSRVANAKKLQELVFHDTLRPMPVSEEPPLELVEEVGRELAELLIAAQRSNGRVVRPLPVHRLRSFMEATAELGEYATLVMTTRQLLDSLERDAILDQQAAAKARQFLGSVERGHPLSPDEPGTGPLYLDGVTVSYLVGAGIVDSLERSPRKLFVHPSTISQMEQLIRTETEGNRSLEILSQLRVWLRDGIAGGQMKVMPRPRFAGEEELFDVGIEAHVLRELVVDVGAADAVLVDDRMLGREHRVVDRSGRAVPIIDTLDLLNDLTRADHFTPHQRWHKHHILRSRGFMCLPVEVEELEYFLRSTEPDPQTGRLRENAELRAIRENLQRLRSTTILQQPQETIYLDRLRVTGITVIRKVFDDSSIPLSTAVPRSDWIYHHLIPSPTDWAHTIVDPAGVLPPVTGLVNQISGLLMLPITDGERRKAFRDWIQTTILAPLEIGSPNVLQDIADNMQTRILSWVNEYTSTH